MSGCGSCGEAVGPDERFCGECGAAIAQRCAACGSPLATAVERLLARLDALGPGHRPPFVSAYALRARARLALARGDGSADVEGLLSSAIDQLGGLGMVVPEIATRLDLRDWLRTQGRGADADRVAASCAEVAREVGAVELLERL